MPVMLNENRGHASSRKWDSRKRIQQPIQPNERKKMIFFSADWHIDHSNIIEYCHRPFKNIQKQANALIRNYNELVSETDICYFIGDFMMDKNEDRLKAYLDRMNGTKILILGNHDKMNPFAYVDAGFRHVHTALDVEEFVLAHDPSASIVVRPKTLLCGHVHDLFKQQKNIINVGIDVWDYRPASIDEIKLMTEGL